MSEQLSATKVTARPGATPERWIVFLHGILGRGNNWRGIARQFVLAKPSYGAVLVDLRAHGESTHLPPPDDLDRAADDVARLMGTLDAPASAVLGHSFGGKVSLALIGRADFSSLVVVDSLPGARPDRRGSEATIAVLDMLDALPARFETRDAFIAHVRAEGHSEDLAKWLAMNLERDAEEWRFGLDVSRIRALLDAYFERDLWAAIDPPPPGMRVELVIGGRSPVFPPEERERARAIAGRHPEAVHVHVLEDAGHWVHVDDPEGLLAIMKEAL